MHLSEVLADDEDQLQRQLRDHPELLPIDEFGLDGPMMVVGREVQLQAGSADLVGLAPSGDPVIVEFKTGPQNSDFRHALAQLLDYGASIWGMAPEEFEAAVVRRYFAGPHCPTQDPARGAATIAEAARQTWPDRDDEDVELFTRHWQRCVADGAFHYVVAAQRFTTTMRRTIEHLNDQTRSAQVYAVEVVRFAGGDIEAFEARTVFKPPRRHPSAGGSRTKIDRDAFVERFTDAAYRDAIEQLLDVAEAQGLQVAWGDTSVSLRVRVPGESQPLTVAWINPPGHTGWMGLTDVTLGYDRGQASKRLGSERAPQLTNYLESVANLSGIADISRSSIVGYHVPPEALVSQTAEVLELLGQVAESVAQASLES